MQIYDLSFNAVMANLNDGCTTFFCPVKCSFIETLKHDLSIDLSDIEQTMELDTVCTGKVYKKAHVKRLPMIYVSDTSKYFDVTILFANVNMLQVIIFQHDEHPDVITVEKDYDAYKLFYEYVGGMDNLRSRMSYERNFMDTVTKESNGSDVDKAFKKTVDDWVIRSLLE